MWFRNDLDSDEVDWKIAYAKAVNLFLWKTERIDYFQNKWTSKIRSMCVQSGQLRKPGPENPNLETQ